MRPGFKRAGIVLCLAGVVAFFAWRSSFAGKYSRSVTALTSGGPTYMVTASEGWNERRLTMIDPDLGSPSYRPTLVARDPKGDGECLLSEVELSNLPPRALGEHPFTRLANRPTRLEDYFFDAVQVTNEVNRDENLLRGIIPPNIATPSCVPSSRMNSAARQQFYRPPGTTRITTGTHSTSTAAPSCAY